MITKLMECPYCNGTGKVDKYEPIINHDDESIKTLKRHIVVCNKCNGTRYVEYVVFTVEEAEAIMKHCGLHIN